MVEVGEGTWGSAWPKMYDALGGNPWAAMPSLHFATSVTAALSLSEAGKVEGALGWGYARHARLRPRLPRRALRHRSPRRGRCWSPSSGAASRSPSPSSTASIAPCVAWSASRAGSVHGVSGEDSANGNGTVEMPLFTTRRLVQTGVVVVLLLVGDLLPLPEAGRARRRAGPARRGRPALDRRRDRLQRPRLRHLHRPLQGGGRGRRAAAELGRDLRDQHGRGGGDAAVLGRRRRRHRPHLLGAAQGGDGAPRRRPADGRLHHPPLRLLPAGADRLRGAAADRGAQRQGLGRADDRPRRASPGCCS